MEGLDGLPMAIPGGIDVVYDTIGQAGDVRGRGPRAEGARHAREGGVHAPGPLGVEPLYFKEINWVGSNAFGIEEVDGVRKHGIEHYLDLVAAGRVDLSGMLTHVFPLSDWRDAFSAIADQQTQRRDQGRHRSPPLTAGPTRASWRRRAPSGGPARRRSTAGTSGGGR